MNQILSTKLKNKRKSYKILLKFQFLFSIIMITFLLVFTFYYFLSLQKKENLSKNLLGNYNIYKLYNNNSEDDLKENQLFGILEIPKINIYYPVFSHLNEELLKVSPCKFYGKYPNQNGNICIAGHNYNNSMFFGNLSLLEKNDEIYLYDNLENKYIYKVFDSYEVDETDLSPIFDYNHSFKELTLVTCNNINKKRIIIKARQ